MIGWVAGGGGFLEWGGVRYARGMRRRQRRHGLGWRSPSNRPAVHRHAIEYELDLRVGELRRVVPNRVRRIDLGVDERRAAARLDAARRLDSARRTHDDDAPRSCRRLRNSHAGRPLGIEDGKMSAAGGNQRPAAEELGARRLDWGPSRRRASGDDYSQPEAGRHPSQGTEPVQIRAMVFLPYQRGKKSRPLAVTNCTKVPSMSEIMRLPPPWIPSIQSTCTN